MNSEWCWKKSFSTSTQCIVYMKALSKMENSIFEELKKHVPRSMRTREGIEDPGGRGSPSWLLRIWATVLGAFQKPFRDFKCRVNIAGLHCKRITCHQCERLLLGWKSNPEATKEERRGCYNHPGNACLFGEMPKFISWQLKNDWFKLVKYLPFHLGDRILSWKPLPAYGSYEFWSNAHL